MLSNDFCELDIFFHSVIISTVVETIVLAHHSLLCSCFMFNLHVNSSCFAGGPDRQTWIDLCQKASLDPYGLINKYFDKLFDLVLDAALFKIEGMFFFEKSCTSCGG